MDPAFLENLFHAPARRVCGYRLRPFSAAHWVALLMVGSPLAPAREGEEKEVSSADLVTAAKICGAPIVRSQGAWLPRGADDLRFGFMDHWRAHRLARAQAAAARTGEARRPPSRFEAELDLFRAHVADFVAPPHVMQPLEAGDSVRGGGALTAPAPFARVALGLRLGLGEERVWSMPLGLLLCLTEVDGEIRGSGRRFYDPADLARWDAQQAAADAAGARLLAEGKLDGLRPPAASP